ncbi:Serine protease, subtilisin family [Actinokineospora alba]|uniref:Serine protease, subtilisin family n=1 Tax=Actinokineospora alba TaxID=504798 RepID=A0A1H0TYG3_9PSEU|nr:S8 family serine peptidase [Actinokineospora alba]TDP70801.1 subtilisin family serine protease [Actinokineospora alba]SDJ16798.1 Serine protease, subtilisin family [Actinokineospora alba]SDP59122.1 Serine protease, subtilisin family [Actinokineospora alba]
MRTFVKAIPVVCLLGLGLLAPLAGAQEHHPTGEIRYTGGADPVPGRYLVALRADTPSLRSSGVHAAAGELLARYGGERKHVFENVFPGYSVVMSERAAKELAADPAVDYVAQTHLVRQTGDTQPNPPSWGIDRSDQKTLPLDKSYTYPNKGEGVHAYVLDSGIRLTHQDLAGRTVNDPDFSGETDNTSNECTTNGHGTHVAGTIGGTQYGLAKAVTLHAVQTVGCGGSAPDDNLVKALDWLVTNAKKPAVANLSLTADTHPYKPLQDAVKRVVASGVVIAIAAGNHGGDACAYTPSDTTEGLIVGGSDSDDTIRDGTNTGKCIDLFAPGGSIVSLNSNTDTGTSTRSGTSMAAPHGAGAAAIYLSANPSATPQQVEAGLVALATDGVLTQIKDSPNKLLNVREIGGGGGDTQAPMVPANLRSTGATSTSISLSWDASTDNVGVTGYDVYNGTTLATTVTGTTATVASLAAGTTHVFTVKAKDAAGNVSAASDPVKASTEPGGGGDDEPPTTPGNPRSTGVTENSVALAWDASVDNVGVTGYDVYNGATVATTVTGTTATVTGLTADTEYSFTIVAKDAAGNTSKPTTAVKARTTGGNTGRTFTNDADFPIRDFERALSPITVTLSGQAAAKVTLSVSIKHTCAEDLGISLIDPNGKVYPVKYSGSGNYQCTALTAPKAYTVSSVVSPAAGKWQLRVTDYGPGDTGTLDSWSITL